MMHSFLVALAYMAMVFAPCAVAQWGDVLTIQWTFRLAPRRRHSVDPMLVALRRERRRAAALAAAEVAPLMEAAFVAPPRIAVAAAPRPFATPMQLHAYAAADARISAFEQGVARVAARLAELAEMHRRANQLEIATAQVAVPTEIRAASSPKKPVVSAHVHAPELVFHYPTQSVQEIDAIYAVAASERPDVSRGVPREADALLLRLNLLIAGTAAARHDMSPPASHGVATDAESQQHSVAA